MGVPVGGVHGVDAVASVVRSMVDKHIAGAQMLVDIADLTCSELMPTPGKHMSPGCTAFEGPVVQRRAPDHVARNIGPAHPGDLERASICVYGKRCAFQAASYLML